MRRSFVKSKATCIIMPQEAIMITVTLQGTQVYSFFMAGPLYFEKLLLSFSGFLSSFPVNGCRIFGADTRYTVIFMRAIHVRMSGT
jgi:hypothetical protein